jgi:hypothetical protein
VLRPVSVGAGAGREEDLGDAGVDEGGEGGAAEGGAAGGIGGGGGTGESAVREAGRALDSAGGVSGYMPSKYV